MVKTQQYSLQEYLECHFSVLLYIKVLVLYPLFNIYESKTALG